VPRLRVVGSLRRTAHQGNQPEVIANITVVDVVASAVAVAVATARRHLRLKPRDFYSTPTSVPPKKRQNSTITNSKWKKEMHRRCHRRHQVKVRWGSQSRTGMGDSGTATQKNATANPHATKTETINRSREWVVDKVCYATKERAGSALFGHRSTAKVAETRRPRSRPARHSPLASLGRRWIRRKATWNPLPRRRSLGGRHVCVAYGFP